jgi:hypothetical protein
VKRRQTSIVLILVSHWRKDFFCLSLQRHPEFIGIFFFVLEHSVSIVVEQHTSIFSIALSYFLSSHPITFVSFAVPIEQG